MTLAEHVERYVTFRRALGHAYVEQARCLHDYVTYAEACGDGFVRTSTVLDWASTTPSPRQAQVKLRYVCDLASVLHADDERHEVPDRDALGKARSRRPSPHLLSLAEIRRIMDAALELAPAGSITPLTFHYILGLIAATGLRRSEATGLLLTDLTADGLLIRKAKFGKNVDRIVMLTGLACPCKPASCKTFLPDHAFAPQITGYSGRIGVRIKFTAGEVKPPVQPVVNRGKAVLGMLRHIFHRESPPCTRIAERWGLSHNNMPQFMQQSGKQRPWNPDHLT